MDCWRGIAAAVVAALVSAAPAAAATTPKGPIKISAAGRIGTLRMNVSTGANIRNVWGKPKVVAHGKVFTPFGPKPAPRYTALGYQCHPTGGFFGDSPAGGFSGGGTTCDLEFYFSDRTRRLVSFTTSLHEFVLFGGVHVGMPANRASALEHHALNALCLTENGKPRGQMPVSAKHLQVQLGTSGGHARSDGTISGGTIDQILIDSESGGVGVADPC